MRFGTKSILVGAAMFAGTTIGAAAIHMQTAGAQTVAQAPLVPPPAPAEKAAPPGGSGPNELSQAFRTAAQRVLPAVVHVEVQGHQTAMAGMQNPLRGTPFEHMFPGFGGGARPMPQVTRASGSGFIFRADGYILTNNHVVDGADKVRVVLQDKRVMDAKVVGRDPNTDVAVLKVDAKDLPVAALGDSDPLQVGDWVVALGYPLDLGATVTSGIISAKGRTIGILGPNRNNQSPIEHYIQTDAAINPGNSGGPLVDLSGRVIGINSAIASPTGYWSGYGFAVPIDLARRVAEDLMRYGEVHRPRLGLAIKDVTPADAQVYHLPNTAGAVVSQISSPSPAADAGVRLGDVIVSVDGAPISSSSDLLEKVALHAPGETVPLGIVRYGKSVTVNVKLGQFDADVKTEHSTARADDDGMGRMGFTVQALTPDIAQQLGVHAGSGVVVSNVDPSSSAYHAGLTPGMVIERFNGAEVKTPADVETRAGGVEEGKAVSLLVRARDGTETVINFLAGE